MKKIYVVDLTDEERRELRALVHRGSERARRINRAQILLHADEGMEDVLHLYAETYDPARPVVCFDEMPYQLASDNRPPLPRTPGSPVRDDFEYVRRGTCNLFGCFEPHAGRRQIVVTDRRTKQDFA